MGRGHSSWESAPAWVQNKRPARGSVGASDRVRAAAEAAAPHSRIVHLSIRTMVGAGRPATPEYTTEPRYLPGASAALGVSVMVPVVPAVAEAGAEITTLPASTLPNAQACNLNGELPDGRPQPCT